MKTFTTVIECITLNSTIKIDSVEFMINLDVEIDQDSRPIRFSDIAIKPQCEKPSLKPWQPIECDYISEIIEKKAREEFETGERFRVLALDAIKSCVED